MGNKNVYQDSSRRGDSLYKWQCIPLDALCVIKNQRKRDTNAWKAYIELHMKILSKEYDWPSRISQSFSKGQFQNDYKCQEIIVDILNRQKSSYEQDGKYVDIEQIYFETHLIDNRNISQYISKPTVIDIPDIYELKFSRANSGASSSRSVASNYDLNIINLGGWNNANSESLSFTLYKFMDLSTEIHEQILNKKCSLSIIFNEFSDYFKSRYEKIVYALKMQRIPETLFASLSATAITDIKEFLMAMSKATIYFYEFNDICDELGMLRKENIHNFFLKMLLEDQQIHSILHEIKTVGLGPILNMYMGVYNHCSDYGPESFMIPPAFCLNRDTLSELEHENTFISMVLESIDKKDEFASFESSYNEEIVNGSDRYYDLDNSIDKDDQFHTPVNSLPAINSISNQLSQANSFKSCAENSTFSRSKAKENVEPESIQIIKNMVKNPYSVSIAFFSCLDKPFSTIQKLKIIVRLVQSIDQEIKDFYRMIGVPVDDLQVTHEDLINIIKYIIVKAAVADLPVIMAVLEEFKPLGTDEGLLGYYHNVLKNSVNEFE